MSTKIYNGFHTGGCTIDDLLPYMGLLRAKIEKINRKQHDLAIVSDAVRVFDLYCWKGRVEESGSPLSIATLQHWDRLHRAKVSGERIWCDPACSLVLIPHPSHAYGMLGIYFTEQKSHRILLQRQSWFHDFSYWDNTDRPNKISARAWREREEIWEAALPGHAPPSLAGVVIELALPEQTWSLNKRRVEAAMPGYLQRVQRLTKDVAWDAFVKREEVPLDSHNVVRTISRCQEYQQTEDGKKELAEINYQVQAKIQKSIGFKDLVDIIPEIVPGE